MSDVDEINALAQLIRCIDGNHTMGAGALAEAILERRAEWDTPRIIRTVEELEALDPDTVVINRDGDALTIQDGDALTIQDLIRCGLAYRTRWIPAVVVATADQVRAAQEALEEE